MTTTITATGVCPVGDHPFTFEVKRGRRPRFCPEHRRSNARNAMAAALLKERNAGKTERHCPRCDTTKDIGEFAVTAPYCRLCMAAWMREKRQSLTAREKRDAERRWRYDQTPEQFQAKLAAQGGRCAICKSDDPGAAGWQQDHDHACCNRPKRGCANCLRDILCTNCNKAIGMLKEDPAIIQAAHDYVVSWKARIEGRKDTLSIPPGIES